MPPQGGPSQRHGRPMEWPCRSQYPQWRRFRSAYERRTNRNGTCSHNEQPPHSSPSLLDGNVPAIWRRNAVLPQGPHGRSPPNCRARMIPDNLKFSVLINKEKYWPVGDKGGAVQAFADRREGRPPVWTCLAAVHCRYEPAPISGRPGMRFSQVGLVAGDRRYATVEFALDPSEEAQSPLVPRAFNSCALTVPRFAP